MILWPDTFSDHLSPEVPRAAARVLARAGLRVELPPAGACCGLTWISTGQLDRARSVLRRTLTLIVDEPEVPLVLLEPSCAAALRRELVDLLPDDPRAARLAARVRTFAQALTPHLDALPRQQQAPKVFVQVHCHQSAVLGFEADREVIRRLGFDVTVLDTGCCGLAGNFGFERGHAEISRRVAEQRLLPALAATSPEDVILADGYSCRTQIAELAGVRALHLAQLIDAGSDPV